MDASFTGAFAFLPFPSPSTPLEPDESRHTIEQEYQRLHDSDGRSDRDGERRTVDLGKAVRRRSPRNSQGTPDPVAVLGSRLNEGAPNIEHSSTREELLRWPTLVQTRTSEFLSKKRIVRHVLEKTLTLTSPQIPILHHM